MLPFIPSTIKHADPSTSPQAVTRHLQLVHRVDVLNVTLDRRSIRCSAKPQVEILMSTHFEKERVVTRVQVGNLINEVQG